MKFNIATVCRARNFAEYVDCVRSAAKEGPCEVVGYVQVFGRGCYNHGIMLTGPEDAQVKFVEHLCIALQPGKYSVARDDDPAVSEGLFEDHTADLVPT